MKSGPIVIIEDDADDKEVLEKVLEELNIKNKLLWFTNCDEVLQYLRETDEKPFVIFSDVNLPGQTGIDFKYEVDHDPELRKKSIPFVFYSTSVDQKIVDEAYTKMTVQGFFQKSGNYSEMKKAIRTIIEYWFLCRHPNS